MKTSKDYLSEANESVPRISAQEAVTKHAEGDHIFIDVRDSSSISETGTIAGALRIPRGMMEFIADDASPMHNSALKKDASIMLVCGAGGQAALTGKTLQDMGFKTVTNVGGIGEWKDAGGAMEN